MEKGITSGTSATTFSPDEMVNRAQLVTFQWRAADSPTVKAANSFSDADSEDYYGTAMLWAIENSITAGTGRTTFSPEAICTRAQLVTFLYRQAA